MDSLNFPLLSHFVDRREIIVKREGQPIVLIVDGCMRGRGEMLSNGKVVKIDQIERKIERPHVLESTMGIDSSCKCEIIW